MWETALEFALIGLGLTFWALAFKIVYEAVKG